MEGDGGNGNKGIGCKGGLGDGGGDIMGESELWLGYFVRDTLHHPHILIPSISLPYNLKHPKYEKTKIPQSHPKTLTLCLTLPRPSLRALLNSLQPVHSPRSLKDRLSWLNRIYILTSETQLQKTCAKDSPWQEQGRPWSQRQIC